MTAKIDEVSNSSVNAFLANSKAWYSKNVLQIEKDIFVVLTILLTSNKRTYQSAHNFIEIFNILEQQNIIFIKFKF